MYRWLAQLQKLIENELFNSLGRNPPYPCDFHKDKETCVHGTNRTITDVETAAHPFTALKTHPARARRAAKQRSSKMAALQRAMAALQRVKCSNGRQIPTRPSRSSVFSLPAPVYFFPVFLGSASQSHPFHEIST